MFNAPPVQQPGGKAPLKPALAGAKQKQRKGVAKAAAKYEPTVFRDQFLKHLESVSPGDLDGYAQKLDSLGNVLDYRKYETELFQLLILGRLLAPGGGYVQDGAPASPFSILSSAKEPAELNNMKTIVEVFNKLMRRYKYLQQPFEEMAVPQLLQYVNKFDAPITAVPSARTSASGVSTPDENPSRVSTPLPGAALAAAMVPRPNQDKIAVALALLNNGGLCNTSVLGSLKKDHLVKDGTSLHFVTTYARAYLQLEALEHFALALRKGGVADILEFFPANRRTIGDLTTHFKKAGLPNVADFYQQKRSASVANETLSHLKDMINGDDSQEEILTFLKEQNKTGAMADTDFITLIWSGIASQLDTDAEPNALADAAVKQIKVDHAMLEAFAQSARTEVALINAVQIWCYEHTQATSAFPKIVKTLYAVDAVSDAAVIFWHAKGSKPQGRAQFLKLAEPLVTFLKEQAEESDEE